MEEASENDALRRQQRVLLLLLLCLQLLVYVDRGIIPGSVNHVNAFITKSTGTAHPDVLLGLLQSSFILGLSAACPLLASWERKGSGSITQLISAGCFTWTASGILAAWFTSCGSYVGLLLCRIASGSGEAALITLYPPILLEFGYGNQLGIWMGLFCAAIPIGTAVGYCYGALCATSRFQFQSAFFVQAVVAFPLVLLLRYQDRGWRITGPRKKPVVSGQLAGGQIYSPNTSPKSTPSCWIDCSGDIQGSARRIGETNSQGGNIHGGESFSRSKNLLCGDTLDEEQVASKNENRLSKIKRLGLQDGEFVIHCSSALENCGTAKPLSEWRPQFGAAGGTLDPDAVSEVLRVANTKNQTATSSERHPKSPQQQEYHFQQKEQAEEIEAPSGSPPVSDETRPICFPSQVDCYCHDAPPLKLLRPLLDPVLPENTPLTPELRSHNCGVMIATAANRNSIRPQQAATGDIVTEPVQQRCKFLANRAACFINGSPQTYTHLAAIDNIPFKDIQPTNRLPFESPPQETGAFKESSGERKLQDKEYEPSETLRAKYKRIAVPCPLFEEKSTSLQQTGGIEKIDFCLAGNNEMNDAMPVEPARHPLPQHQTTGMSLGYRILKRLATIMTAGKEMLGTPFAWLALCFSAYAASISGYSTYGAAFLQDLGFLQDPTLASISMGTVAALAGVVGSVVGGMLTEVATNSAEKSCEISDTKVESPRVVASDQLLSGARGRGRRSDEVAFYATTNQDAGKLRSKYQDSPRRYLVTASKQQGSTFSIPSHIPCDGQGTTVAQVQSQKLPIPSGSASECGTQSQACCSDNSGSTPEFQDEEVEGKQDSEETENCSTGRRAGVTLSLRSVKANPKIKPPKDAYDEINCRDSGASTQTVGSFVDDAQKRFQILQSLHSTTILLLVPSILALISAAVVQDMKLFLGLFGSGLAGLFATQAGLSIAVMISVDRSHRTSAIALNTVLMHLTGDVPAPVVVGFIKDLLAPHCGLIFTGTNTEISTLTIEGNSSQHRSFLAGVAPSLGYYGAVIPEWLFRSTSVTPDMAKCAAERAGIRTTIALTTIWLCWMVVGVRMAVKRASQLLRLEPEARVAA